MRIGQRCAGCDRVMRPAGTRLAEWPGTIAYHSRGMCYPCRRAQKRGGSIGQSTTYRIVRGQAWARAGGPITRKRQQPASGSPDAEEN